MIRTATLLDLTTVWSLREATKALLFERGIDQWQHSNPSIETFKKDIELNELFVYEENGIILGMIAIKKGVEHTYDIIYDGSWGYDLPYITIHRLAVKKELLGQLVSRALLGYAETYAKEHDIHYIRIDTHETNRFAIRLFETLGYQKRGFIMLENDLGDLKRIALDKKI